MRKCNSAAPALRRSLAAAEEKFSQFSAIWRWRSRCRQIPKHALLADLAASPELFKVIVDQPAARLDSGKHSGTPRT